MRKLSPRCRISSTSPTISGVARIALFHKNSKPFSRSSLIIGSATAMRFNRSGSLKSSSWPPCGGWSRGCQSAKRRARWK